MRIVLKVCQTVGNISMTIQSQEFFNLIFGRFFDIWNHCATAATVTTMPLPPASTPATAEEVLFQ